MQEKEIKASDFIQSLEKGLNLIASFDAENPYMTITEAAERNGLTRANARRVLLTLEYLGYVRQEKGKLFRLTPKVLCLGYSYLSSLDFRELALPVMEGVSATLQESCSMAVRDDLSMVYVARVQTKRIMSVTLGVGTRLPLYCTSMGKVLLAGLEEEELQSLVQKMSFEAHTPKTIIRAGDLMKELDTVRRQGWALADEETEIGVRSVACPVRGKDGSVLAALNVSVHASRATKQEVEARFLPEVKAAALAIEEIITHKT